MRQLQMVRTALTHTLSVLTGTNGDRELALARLDRFAVERRVFAVAMPEAGALVPTSQRAA